MRRIGARVIASLAWLAVAGCDRGEPLPAPPSLVVELSGCGAVLAGPVCEIGASPQIRLWIKASADAILTLRAGAAEIVAPREPVDGGVRIPIAVTPEARAITVTATRGGASAEVRIALAARESAPAIDHARALRKQGRLDEAARSLEALLVDPSATVRQQATRDLARVERARGAGERAAIRFREAIARDHDSARISDEIDDRLALAYTLLFDARDDAGRFEEARAVLAAVEPLAPGYDDGRARAPYYLGLVASETGDLRAALPLFRLAAERSARLGLVDERLDALAMWADTLAVLGRHDEASAILREIEATIPRDAAVCRRAQLLNNAGWIALRAPTSGAARDPRPPLVTAIDLYRRDCPSPPKLGNALTNLALAEIDRGRRPEARRLLDEARAAAPGAAMRIQVFWKILEGRLDLEEGRLDEARRAYDELAVIGDRAAIPEARLEAAIGRAQALDAAGALPQARAAYEESTRILDDWSRLAPLGEGRDTFLARQARRAPSPRLPAPHRHTARGRDRRAPEPRAPARVAARDRSRRYLHARIARLPRRARRPRRAGRGRRVAPARSPRGGLHRAHHTPGRAAIRARSGPRRSRLLARSRARRRALAARARRAPARVSSAARRLGRFRVTG
jgi:tetratricopeptide (TPR) repeat protein